jgi:hypothetical protein
MGYYTTNTVETNTHVVGTLYTEADGIINFLKEKLIHVGWTSVRKVTAEITFNALAIVPGNEITLDGALFIFYSTLDPPPAGGFPVPITPGDDTETIITTWAVVVYGAIQWLSTRPTTNSIRFYGDTGQEIDNNLICSVFPTGSVGVFSSSTGATGEGFTYKGGWIVASASVHGNPINVKLVTNGTNVRINVSDDLDISLFDGFQTTSSTLVLTANKYQFFLYRNGTTAMGTSLYAGHLKPLGGALFFNYITGPVNPVLPDGGGRRTLEDIAGRYYVDVGTRYFASDGTGTASQVPCFCFPGMGFGKTSLDKLVNQIAAMNLFREDGSGVPYEPMLAVCVASPALSGAFAICGAFWDSLILSTYAVADTAVQLNGIVGKVHMSQPGSSANSRGSFVIRTV